MGSIESGKIADSPRRGEEAALARVHFGHTDASVFRVRRRSRTVRIVASADPGGTDPPSLAAGNRLCGVYDSRERLKCFHD